MGLEDDINDLLKKATGREGGGTTRVSARQLSADIVARMEAHDRAIRMLAQAVDQLLKRVG